jgi:rubrerythrin
MDRMSSIELALKNEKTEMAYYLAEAQRSENELARAMFETLAHDEEEHMQRLTALHERLIAKGSWPQDVKLEVKGTNVKQVLDGLTAKLGGHTSCDGNDVQALEKAAKFEASGAKFYADLSAACENPAEKSFFTFLSSIEREHLRTIESSLAFFKDPASYMMEHGKAGLDGA